MSESGTVSFACKHCGKAHRAKAALAGRRMRCSCGQVIRVPGVASAGPKSDAARPSLSPSPSPSPRRAAPVVASAATPRPAERQTQPEPELEPQPQTTSPLEADFGELAPADDGMSEYELAVDLSEPPPPPPPPVVPADTQAPDAGASRGRKPATGSSRAADNEKGIGNYIDPDLLKKIIALVVVMVVCFVAYKLVMGWYAIEAVIPHTGYALLTDRENQTYVALQEHPDGSLLEVVVSGPQWNFRHDGALSLTNSLTGARFDPKRFTLRSESGKTVTAAILLLKPGPTEMWIESRGSEETLGASLGGKVYRKGQLERVPIENRGSVLNGAITVATPQGMQALMNVSYGVVQVTAPTGSTVWMGGPFDLDAGIYDRVPWRIQALFDRTQVEDGRMSVYVGETRVGSIRTSPPPPAPDDPPFAMAEPTSFGGGPGFGSGAPQLNIGGGVPGLHRSPAP